VKGNRLIYVIILGCAVPAAARAQSAATAPQKYCAELSRTVDRYIASDHGENHLAVQGYGKAACRESEPGNAIPVLERRLEAAKLPLPPHTASVAEFSARSATSAGS
jgi:hypothetical protein